MGAATPSEESVPDGTVRAMMGMGGTGRRAAERRRLVATVVVLMMVLALGAVLLSSLLG